MTNTSVKRFIWVLASIFLLCSLALYLYYIGMNFVRYGHPTKLSLVKDCKLRLVNSGQTYSLLDSFKEDLVPTRYLAAKGISNYLEYYMLIAEYPHEYRIYWFSSLKQPMSKKLDFRDGKQLMDRIIDRDQSYKSFKSRYNQLDVHNACDFVRIYDGKSTVTLEYLNSYDDDGDTPEEKLMGVFSSKLFHLMEEGDRNSLQGELIDSKHNWDKHSAEKLILKNTFFELDERFIHDPQ